MKQTIIYSILITAYLFDTIFQLLIAFMFSYCFGYFMFEVFKKKVKKKKLKNFFQHIMENMASKEGDVSDLQNKFSGIEINLDNFSIEKKFLEELKQKLSEVLQECVGSYYIRKKSIAICCETFLLTVETSRKFLRVIDKLISDMLFLPDGLARLGWCTNYQVNSRIVYNKNEKGNFEKIQISDFYWFNYSASEKMCDCFYCHCFKKSK